MPRSVEELEWHPLDALRRRTRCTDTRARRHRERRTLETSELGDNRLGILLRELATDGLEGVDARVALAAVHAEKQHQADPNAFAVHPVYREHAIVEVRLHADPLLCDEHVHERLHFVILRAPFRRVERRDVLLLVIATPASVAERVVLHLLDVELRVASFPLPGIRLQLVGAERLVEERAAAVVQHPAHEVDVHHVAELDLQDQDEVSHNVFATHPFLLILEAEPGRRVLALWLNGLVGCALAMADLAAFDAFALAGPSARWLARAIAVVHHAVKEFGLGWV